MNSIEIIERLCGLIDDAQEIIRKQTELMAMHGIMTDDGKLGADRMALLNAIQRTREHYSREG